MHEPAPTADDRQPEAATPRKELPWRRIAVAAGVWVALATATLVLAAAMDRTPAPTPPPPESVAPNGLPLLRLYLDRDLPADVAALDTLAAQVTELERRATTDNNPARWVELGTIAQRAGDLVAAQSAFRRALEIDEDRLDAQVGIAMNQGALGPDGLVRAAAQLDALVSANPDSQLAVFNRGMVAVYQADRPTITRAFARAIELGPGTPLGTLARTFSGATP